MPVHLVPFAALAEKVAELESSGEVVISACVAGDAAVIVTRPRRRAGGRETR